MFFKAGDTVLILKGKDFDGNDLTGKKAIIANPMPPSFKDATIEVEGAGYQMFFPKEWLKVIGRE